MEIQLFHFKSGWPMEPPGRCAPRAVRRLFPEGLDADVGADAESDLGAKILEENARAFSDLHGIPGLVNVYILQWKITIFFLMGKSTISMAMFNCYVSSPEGIANYTVSIYIYKYHKHS